MLTVRIDRKDTNGGSMSGVGKMKVLYVSDSLGTPIHPRGIFNYSVSLVEILKDLNAEITLVVEKTPGYGIDDRLKKEARSYSPVALNTSRLAEIYRYFNESHFHFRWRYKRLFQTVTRRLPVVARGVQAGRDLIFGNRAIPVDNRIDQIEFIPPKGEHLAPMSSFLFRRGFYSSSMTRAVNGLDPVKLDGRGYDLAIIDTPHFVKLFGIPAERTFVVIHDLIPLRDPTMDANWRYLFIKKLQASMALKSNLIFVSNHTRNLFHATFSEHRAPSETIIFPAIRKSLMDAIQAGGAVSAPISYLPRAPVEEPMDDEIEAKKGGEKAKKAKRKSREIDLDSFVKKGWEPDLPYFATMVSDERRKNIKILVDAFRLLKGRANIVIMGQVDAKRYLGSREKELANVHFAGFVSDAEKMDTLRGASGVIFPSLAEGFGIPIVEGAVMGLPVICSDIPVFREIAEEYGNYFDPHNPRSLVTAVETVLGDPVGQTQRAETLKEAVTARFSQEAMRAQLVKALGNIVGAASAERYAALEAAH